MKIILTIFKFRNECYRQLERKKYKKKNGVICLASMFSSLIVVLKLFKKYIFCDFVLTSGRNLGLLKQFTYIHQEIVLFIMQWLTVSEILGFEVEEFC